MSEKPTPKAMQKALKTWMTNEENNSHRLVGASKIKELAKAMDPKIRLDTELQAAVCRKVATMIKEAMKRCYDNKRSTIRPSDL